MRQQGQVFELQTMGADGRRLWAYRYRAGGRGSRRVQRGGFESEQAAVEALERALERLRREQGLVQAPRLSELVDIYLAQHDGEPETVEKLRWLLAKAVRSFGHRRISQLRPAEIAAWRMTIPAGHRFEATQALRQVLARAVSWGLIDVNPAKQGVDNPQRRRTEKRPFESWDEVHGLARSSAHTTDRWCCSRRPPDCGRGSGSRSSIATSIGKRASSMSAARIGTAASRCRRRKRAFAPCRCRRSPSPRSSGCTRTGGRAWCFRRPVAATSTCTTSATATGSPLSSRPGSCRAGASTISGTPSRRSRFAQASQPSSSRATWERASE